jgi:surface antigen
MHRYLVAFLMVVLVPAVAHADALGLNSIVKGGPLEDFRETDWALLEQSVKQAALSAPGSPPIEWSNAATGTHGTVRVTRRFERPNEGDCRELRGTNSARARKTKPFRITLCQGADGQWHLTTNDP